MAESPPSSPTLGLKGILLQYWRAQGVPPGRSLLRRSSVDVGLPQAVEDIGGEARPFAFPGPWAFASAGWLWGPPWPSVAVD